MMTLHRIDPGRNLRRFYRVHTIPTLFGEWQVWREWGRIGQGGTLKIATYHGQAEAERAQQRSVRSKLRRGYKTLD